MSSVASEGAATSPRHISASIWVAFEGAGLAIVVMLRLLWVHISPLHEDLFHRNLPMTAVYRGILIDFVVVCAAAIALLLWMDRRDPEKHSFGWIFVAAIAASRAAGWAQENWVDASFITPCAVFLSFAAAGVLLWVLRRRWYGVAIQGLRLALMLVGFSICWMLPQLTWMAAYPEPVQASSFAKAPGPMAQRRIVWILFDELSRDQTFDRRYPGLVLPAFDAFAAQSVSFSDVQPGGYMTELIIPGLMDGESISQEKTNLDGRLFVKTAENPQWHPYAADKSLLADARQVGWSTGVSGWFLPYCRLYADQLNDCFRTMRFPLPGGYSRGHTTAWNAVAPMRKSLLRVEGRPVRGTTPAELHARDFEEILSHGEAMIADERIGFVFLHLPAPHPAGFYNRATGEMGYPGSYVDNLALADKTLAELLQRIAQTQLAARTTIIVSSDHSWRIPMWRPLAGWTREDEAALGDRGFDQRPVLMVRFPQERRGGSVDAGFPLIREHDMMERILDERIRTPQELEQWATGK
ncbi:MAG TPA: hypothetical protein VKT75_12645 [Acidobacteriaceae bacterium]|nr:hypothetical protein [Acidobacteriaceae bacterium]